MVNKDMIPAIKIAENLRRKTTEISLQLEDIMTSKAKHHPKNVERAGWSKNALAVFTEETYNGDHPDSMNQENIRDAIQDLITDLFHYANQCGFDVKEIHRHAMGMYEEELAEPEF